MSFTLEAHEGMVKLTLVHDELPDKQAAQDFREGWSPILSSLKTMLETGKPLPQLRRRLRARYPRLISEHLQLPAATGVRRCGLCDLRHNPPIAPRPSLICPRKA